MYRQHPRVHLGAVWHRFGGRIQTPGATMNYAATLGGAVAQLGARLDGIEEVVGSNPIGSTNFHLECGGLAAAFSIAANTPDAASACKRYDFLLPSCALLW